MDRWYRYVWTWARGALGPWRAAGALIGLVLVVASMGAMPGRAYKTTLIDRLVRRARSKVLQVCPASGCPAGGPTQGSLGEALTYTGASVHTCPNDDGSVQVLLSGYACEPQASGAVMPTTNWMSASNNVGGVGWTAAANASCAASTLTQNTTDVTAPDGTSTASKVVSVACSIGGGYEIFTYESPVIVPAPANVIGSIYARTLSGTVTFNLYSTQNTTQGSFVQCTATPTWSRCFVGPTQALAGGWNLEIGYDARNSFSSSTGISGGTVYLWGAQLEPVGANTVPTPLVVTTSSQAMGNFHGYGARLRPATTNLLQFYNSMSTAPWGVGSTTCAAPTLVANSTDLLDPNGGSTALKATFPACSAGGSNTDVAQVWTATAAPWTGSVYARTLSGSYTFNVIETLTGASGFQNTCTAVSTQWTRCILPNSTLTAASWALELGFDGRGVGSAAISAGTVYLDFAQEEANTFASDVCPTAGASATCAADNLTAVPNNFPTSTGCLAMDFYPPTSSISNLGFLFSSYNGGDGVIVQPNGSNMLCRVAHSAVFYDDTTSPTIVVGRNHLSFGWDASGSTCTVSGSTATNASITAPTANQNPTYLGSNHDGSGPVGATLSSIVIGGSKWACP